MFLLLFSSACFHPQLSSTLPSTDRQSIYQPMYRSVYPSIAGLLCCRLILTANSPPPPLLFPPRLSFSTTCVCVWEELLSGQGAGPQIQHSAGIGWNRSRAKFHMWWRHPPLRQGTERLPGATFQLEAIKKNGSVSINDQQTSSRNASLYQVHVHLISCCMHQSVCCSKTAT